MNCGNFGLFSQLLKLRFTAMVTYSFHLYSRSSHHFIKSLIAFVLLSLKIIFAFQDGDHSFKGRRFLPQDTTKFGCPAKIFMSEVIRFPGYKIKLKYKKVKQKLKDEWSQGIFTCVPWVALWNSIAIWHIKLTLEQPIISVHLTVG